jgi:Ca-activated chloride channel family protein
MMKNVGVIAGLALSSVSVVCVAQQVELTQDPLADLSARQAVREGNERLIQRNPAGALEAYNHAEVLEPDARQIAFVEGLAHYDLNEFDRAREAFRKAAAFADDPLADDAMYSLGTCDHAEALGSLDNPQLALSLLENAMGRYHDVLARRPDHAAARDANFKAASMWRQIKQQMQEQQQQQDSCDNGEQQDGDEEKKEDQESQQNEDQQQQEQQQSQPSDEQQDEQQQEQSESAEQSEDQQQQQQAQAEQQEQVSREQAERKLREMMQALRDRRKTRREPVQRVPVTQVDKDW